MWILAFIFCLICPPIGGIMLILLVIGTLSSSSGRSDYLMNSDKYYRNRGRYFKKTYGI